MTSCTKWSKHQPTDAQRAVCAVKDSEANDGWCWCYEGDLWNWQPFFFFVYIVLWWMSWMSSSNWSCFYTLFYRRQRSLPWPQTMVLCFAVLSLTLYMENWTGASTQQQDWYLFIHVKRSWRSTAWALLLHLFLTASDAKCTIQLGAPELALGREHQNWKVHCSIPTGSSLWPNCTKAGDIDPLKEKTSSTVYRI